MLADAQALTDNTENKHKPGSHRCRCPYHRNPANQEFTIDYGPMGNPNDIESGSAIVEPALCQRIEFLRFQAEHLGANNKLRTGLLLSNQIIN